MTESDVDLPTELVDSPSIVAAWFAVMGGIGAWMAHLIAESSLADYSCAHNATWVMHAVTAVCLVVALAALLVSLRLTRVPSRPWMFVGWLGVISSLVNVLLIVFEGSYVAVVHCR